MKQLLSAGAILAVSLTSPALAQSDAEREAARANFQEADANSDRVLNRSEFRSFINANAEDGIGRAGMVRRFRAYDRAFGNVDQNGDGVVTPAELSAARSE